MGIRLAGAQGGVPGEHIPYTFIPSLYFPNNTYLCKEDLVMISEWNKSF
jgi:hypothetical protein